MIELVLKNHVWKYVIVFCILESIFAQEKRHGVKFFKILESNGKLKLENANFQIDNRKDLTKFLKANSDLEFRIPGWNYPINIKKVKNKQRVLVKRPVPHGYEATSLEYDPVFKSYFRPVVKVHKTKKIEDLQQLKSEDDYSFMWPWDLKMYQMTKSHEIMENEKRSSSKFSPQHKRHNGDHNYSQIRTSIFPFKKYENFKRYKSKYNAPVIEKYKHNQDFKPIAEGIHDLHRSLLEKHNRISNLQLIPISKLDRVNNPNIKREDKDIKPRDYIKIWHSTRPIRRKDQNSRRSFSRQELWVYPGQKKRTLRKDLQLRYPHRTIQKRLKLIRDLNDGMNRKKKKQYMHKLKHENEREYMPHSQRSSSVFNLPKQIRLLARQLRYKEKYWGLVHKIESLQNALKNVMSTAKSTRIQSLFRTTRRVYHLLRGLNDYLNNVYTLKSMHKLEKVEYALRRLEDFVEKIEVFNSKHLRIGLDVETKEEVEEVPLVKPAVLFPHYPFWNYWTYHKTIPDDECTGTNTKSINNVCVGLPPHRK